MIAKNPRVAAPKRDYGLPLLCRMNGIPRPVAEHRFHETRKWRFDFAWLDAKIALEIEGGVWIGGRHSRGSGFVKDMEKYNAAAALGWRTFRSTPKQGDIVAALGLIRAAMGGR